MKKLHVFFTVLVLLCVSVTVSAQNINLKGTVKDASGNPVVGASVLLEGNATTYTMTDANGSYQLSVPADGNLEFNCLGYKGARIPVNSRAVIDVVLEVDTEMLDETIVVAYGTASKSSFTGSASVVKNESLEKISTSNVTNALQGLSAGVQVINSSGQPGDSGSISIRGIGSMNASSSPLYVVDGVAYSGYVNAISTNDIESITVLKDASATALYGSRAANGVIMITTKKGTSENGKITFRSSLGFASLAVPMPRQLDPTEYAQITGRAIQQANIDGGMDYAEASAAAAATLANELKINPWPTDKIIDADGNLLVSNDDLLWYADWRNELIKVRPRQEYNLDFSGRKGDTQYFFSGSYLNDRGIFTTQKFERVSGRSNVSTKIKPWLEFGTNTSFAHSLTDAPASDGVVWFLRTVPSTYNIYKYDYTTNAYARDSEGNKIYEYGSDRPNWAGWNLLADAKYNSYVTNVDQISTRDYLDFKIMNGLNFRSTLSLDYYITKYDGYGSAEYGNSAGEGGNAQKSYDRNVATTWTNLLTWNRDFGEHNVSVMLGEESFSRNVTGVSAGRKGFPFGGLKELSAAATPDYSTSYEDNYRLLSFFSRAEYNYADKYYVSGSVRTDGSSRFAKSSRWGTFWSVGASWRLNNESFMQDIDWIDNLKLKASYGAVGNDELNSWYCYQGLYAAGYNDLTNAGVVISRLPNETLKWETNLQFNTGVDFSLFNRLTGSFEFFNRKSKDLLFTMPMALSTGFSGIDRNIGDVKNYGVELTLDYQVFNTKDFQWNVNFNTTHYENKITSLPQDEMNAGYFKWREGESRYNFWGVEYAGVNPENGNDQFWMNVYDNVTDPETGETSRVVVDRVKTESTSDVTSDDQKKYLGSAIPDFYGGFTNTFSWKGFDLSVMLYYSIGGKLYDTDYSQMAAYRRGFMLHPDLLTDSWTPEHTDAKLPRVNRNTVDIFSTKYLFNNSFLRLRNVTLGYSLPKTLLSKINVESCRVYVQGDNLLTFGSAQRRGTDPEQSISGTTSNRFPTTKVFTFGVQITL